VRARDPHRGLLHGPTRVFLPDGHLPVVHGEGGRGAEPDREADGRDADGRGEAAPPRDRAKLPRRQAAAHAPQDVVPAVHPRQRCR
jgi:hypothetical protein